MANFPFKINQQTKNGTQFSFYTSSFATDAESLVSASVMVEKINLIRTATSYTQDNVAPGLHASKVYTTVGAGSAFLSASYTEPNTGSIVFTDTEVSTNGGLDFYTFWGTKVCSVLGLPEGIPIYTENFKLSDDSDNPTNYLSGDVIATGIAVKESFKIAPQGRVKSNLVWDEVFGEGLVQWVSGSYSKLLMGYDDVNDEYILKGAATAGGIVTTFNISGVDDLNASTVVASSVSSRKLFTGSTDIDLLAARSSFSSTTYDRGQLQLGSDGHNILTGQLIIQDSESETFASNMDRNDFQLYLRNNHSDTVDNFAGIAFDVGTEDDSDAIMGAIAVLRDNATTALHDGNMIFCTNDDADDDLAERMRITHDGMVGIGTPSPSSLLHLSSDTADVTLTIEADSGNDTEGHNPSILLTQDGGLVDFGIGIQESDNHSYFDNNATGRDWLFSVSGTEKVRITGDGKLLIGRSSEAATTKNPKLEIDGYISFDGFLSRAGTGGSNNGANIMNFLWDGVYIDGWVDTTEVWPNETSDYRIKENVATMTGSFDNGILKKVNDLRPINYTQKSCSIWIQSDDARVSFLAHEMADVFPNIVKGEYNATGSSGEPIMQSYNNTHLTTYLVKAVQELTQAHNHLIAAITGSTDLNHLKASVTGSLIG